MMMIQMVHPILTNRENSFISTNYNETFVIYTTPNDSTSKIETPTAYRSGNGTVCKSRKFKWVF
jgi:hypothetical protein